MKKLFKTALVLTALALMSVACSNAKTTSIVGTYYGGEKDNLSMKVNTSGVVSISKKDESIKDESLTSIEYLINENSFSLIPWDLTSEKPTLSYTVKQKVDVSTTETPDFVEQEIKFDFTKEKESYKCVISSTLPDKLFTLINDQRLKPAKKDALKDKNIKLEFTKPISK